jgi:hypothetical protein
MVGVPEPKELERLLYQRSGQFQLLPIAGREAIEDVLEQFPRLMFQKTDTSSSYEVSKETKLGNTSDT